MTKQALFFDSNRLSQLIFILLVGGVVLRGNQTTEAQQDFLAGSKTPSDPKKAFYVDPVNGDKSGDGSPSRPWKTLSEVIQLKLVNGEDNTKGKVHAGDVIYLMTGNHGSVTMNSHTGQFNNRDFITVQAAPDQRPTLHQLSLIGAKWVFRGLTFECPKTIDTTYKLANVTSSQDIVFDGNTFWSRPDVSDWESDEWLKSGAYCGIAFTGQRATITNNLIKNVRRGIVIDGEAIELADNKIDYFADDGIDFTSSNTVIKRNQITNHFGRLKDGNHNDAIQGWTVGGKTNRNLLIDGNQIVVSTGEYPAIPPLPKGIDSDSMQGIAIFDGVWNDVTITNNVITASAYHGLTINGASNCMIANNIVVTQIADPKVSTWLMVGAGKKGEVIENVVVRNNIATLFNLPKAGVMSDHNISLSLKSSNLTKVASNRVIQDPKKIFVKFEPMNANFDFNLRRGSPAVGAGSDDKTPKTDIQGRERVPQKYDIGAYAFVGEK